MFRIKSGLEILWTTLQRNFLASWRREGVQIISRPSLSWTAPFYVIIFGSSPLLANEISSYLSNPDKSVMKADLLDNNSVESEELPPAEDFEDLVMIPNQKEREERIYNYISSLPVAQKMEMLKDLRKRLRKLSSESKEIQNKIENGVELSSLTIHKLVQHLALLVSSVGISEAWGLTNLHEHLKLKKADVEGIPRSLKAAFYASSVLSLLYVAFEERRISELEVMATKTSISRDSQKQLLSEINLLQILIKRVELKINDSNNGR